MVFLDCGGLLDLHELIVDVLVFGWSKADQQPTLELSPRRDSFCVLKPIVPLYCISLKVDDSDVHHGSFWCLVIAEVAFFARNPSRRLVGISGRNGDGSRMQFRVDNLRFRLLLVLRFEGVMEARKDFSGSGLKLGKKV
ncbi:hypothetical protein B296_00006977 [Ensete ventricosum]|uniref:Uncharacterized protein n=1 Tax=Ensete ventricosum TaxID=4639 RepID=A0A426ZYD1_ENSVE|nr:hypothetical protein B296_00006977 [Ensete ventricosum]